MANNAALLESSPQLLLKNAEDGVRRGFVRKVYGILSVQLLLTVLIAAPFQNMSNQVLAANLWMLQASLVVMVATTCVTVCCQDTMRKFPMNYLLLGTLTGSMGVMVGFSAAMYTWQSVALAAGITVAIFVGMTILACFTDTDFTGAGPYLLAALMTMTMFGLAISLLSFFGVHCQAMLMFYNFCGVIMFTFYIVYDTQLIIGGNHKIQFGIDDYAFAALNLYLDIVNLFLYVLSLVGDRKN